MARKLSDAMAQDARSNVDPLVIQACLAEYTTTDTQIKRLAQQQAAMLKRYEGQGVSPRSIKKMHRAAKLDKAVARAEAQEDARYYIICGILSPATDEWARQVSQSTLFDAEDSEFEPLGTVSPDLARARAHTDGYNSGRHGGEAINNPFLAGSQEHVAWLEGLKEGQADHALRGKGAAPRNADATPRRGRGRPTGSTKKRNGEDDAAVAGHA
jgi:ribosome modulation factor